MVHHLHRVGQSVLKVVSRRLQLRWTCMQSFGFVRIWPQFMQSCVCILSVYSLDKHRAVIWNICVIASVVFTDSTSQWRPNDTRTHNTYSTRTTCFRVWSDLFSGSLWVSSSPAHHTGSLWRERFFPSPPFVTSVPSFILSGVIVNPFLFVQVRPPDGPITLFRYKELENVLELLLVFLKFLIQSSTFHNNLFSVEGRLTPV